MKLLRKRDYLLLGLALVGDVAEGFVKRGRGAIRYGNLFFLLGGDYKRTNFLALAGGLLRTGQIERVIDKKGNAVLRLAPPGREYLTREFPLERLRLRWDGRWIVVVFDIPEEERWIRDRLRLDLEDLGFGMLQKSVWISPFPIAEDLREFLISSGLAGQALVMVGPWLLAGSPKELARGAFKLDRINERYGKIIYKWDASDKTPKDKKRFASKYLQILASDPLLPYQLLPDDWLGKEAREIFKKILRS